jgi:hypothetical protein
MRTWGLVSLALAVALVLALSASAGSGRADEGPGPRLVERAEVGGVGAAGAPGQLAVRFKHGVSDTSAKKLLSALGAEVVKKHPRSGLHRAAPREGASVEAVLEGLRSNPLVAEANVVRVATILDAPNDTNYSYQWHMHNTDGGMWADIAWNLAPSRGAGVTVAVIDSGVAF